ncbi:MAG: phosphoribosylaminoimidazolesuccinocarboxamide synthase [Actinomycetota bacterium]|nr:phosphoribosylaminoimidazolesuccinocarboxamide synthase [Actinomycetota bacterium]
MPAGSEHQPATGVLAVEPFTDIDLPLPDRRDGKVRVSFSLDASTRLFVTSDRLSAFDRILAGVPYKGQVLNQLSAWWFERTADLVPNHAVSTPDPNVLVARAARPLPVEVVVRGFITGITDTSLWQRYAAGARVVDGHRLPDGLTKNTELPTPLVTPTTKADAGTHDVPLSCKDVVDRRIVERALWDDVIAAALAVFERGQRVAAGAGLILADTKYEFGLDESGELLLIDEVHTPDSSRFWLADGYEERLAAGEEPESLDKEVVRRAYADAGYRGDGPPPDVGADIWTATSDRYMDAYRRLTGRAFEPGSYPVGPRIGRWLDTHTRDTAGKP